VEDINDIVTRIWKGCVFTFVRLRVRQRSIR